MLLSSHNDRKSHLEVLNKKGLNYPLADAEKELFKELSQKSITENTNIALESYDSELDALYYRKTIPKESLKAMVSKIVSEI